MGQNRVAPVMRILDTTRYPRLRKFALRGIKTTVEPRGVRAL